MFKYVIFILTFFILSSLKAEESYLTLKQQLDRMQRELSDLSQSFYTGSRSKQIKIKDEQNQSSNLTAFDLRIYDLEKDIKKLNKNYEELIFQIDDIIILLENLEFMVDNKLNVNLQEIIKLKDDSDLKEVIIIEDNMNSKEKNILGTIVINSEDLSDKSKKNVDDEILDNQEEVKIILSPDEEFQKAFDLLRSQKFIDAKNAFKLFIDNHPENKLAGSAHYWLGEIYLLKKQYTEAALILAEGYQKFPIGLKAPDILYRLSESLVNIDKIDDACNTLQKFTREFSKNKLLVKVENKITALECQVLFE